MDRWKSAYSHCIAGRPVDGERRPGADFTLEQRDRNLQRSNNVEYRQSDNGHQRNAEEPKNSALEQHDFSPC